MARLQPGLPGIELGGHRALVAGASEPSTDGDPRRELRPASSLFFWLVLELPIQVPLLLAVLGLFQGLDVAFYVTALAFNLFEAAFVLARVCVPRRALKPPTPRSHGLGASRTAEGRSSPGTTSHPSARPR